MADPENLKEIGIGIGAFLVAAVGAVKVWKVRVIGPNRSDLMADLSAQVEGRFREVCGRLDRLDSKNEDTQTMLRTYLLENAKAVTELQTNVTNHGRRLDNLEHDRG